jgi:hypothetical protein
VPVLDERVIEERSNEAPEFSPLEACMQLFLVGSIFQHLSKNVTPVPFMGEPRSAAASFPRPT